MADVHPKIPVPVRVAEDLTSVDLLTLILEQMYITNLYLSEILGEVYTIEDTEQED